MALSQKRFFKKIIFISLLPKGYFVYFSSILVVGIIIMLIITALESAAVADWSFKAINLEQRLNELRETCSNLEMEINQRESMATLDKEIKNLPLLEMSSVDYLVPQESVVVAK
jgi:hypothetical protein